MFSIVAYLYEACTVRVSTGSKFRLVSKFMELHALTLTACSYVLLIYLYHRKLHDTHPTHLTEKLDWLRSCDLPHSDI